MLGEIFTILNDQDSMIIMITQAKWGVALKCPHIKEATILTKINGIIYEYIVFLPKGILKRKQVQQL